MRLEFGCVAVSPAEILQCVQASLLERNGRGGRASFGALRDSGAAGDVNRRSLEPWSSEGGGGKIGHLLEPPSSSGHLQVCLQAVTKSNPRLAFAGRGARVLAGKRPERSRVHIFWGAGQT
jgi:hypothetical protein